MARKVAGFAVREDRLADPGVDLGALSDEFEPRVEAYTGLVPSEAIPRPEVVSREGWVDANLTTMADLMQPVEQRMAERFERMGALAGPLRMGAGAALGAELGLVTGYLAQRVLGQYELSLIAGSARPRLLFVGVNLLGVAKMLNVDRDAFVRWVAVHELTHAHQFGGVPWLREHIGGLLREYLATVDVKLEANPKESRGDDDLDADDATDVGETDGEAADSGGAGAGAGAAEAGEGADGDAGHDRDSGQAGGGESAHGGTRRRGGLLGDLPLPPAVEGFVDKLRNGDVNVSLPDPADLAERFREGGLAALVQTEEQRGLMDRMQAAMAVVEGHAEHVMDALGPELVPNHEQLRAAMDARRASRSAPERVLLRLLGMEMKMRQYKLGKEFCDAVVAEGGMDALNRVWQGPDALPDLAEIERPHDWMARMDRDAGRLPAG